MTSAERGREVRQRLLSAAAELIAERGWAAVSTRLLGERAGVAGGLRLGQQRPQRREVVLHDVASVMASVRGRFADWLAVRGVPDPVDTAATVVAAVDGVMLHRALDPGLTAGVVASVLGRSVR